MIKNVLILVCNMQKRQFLQFFDLCNVQKNVIVDIQNEKYIKFLKNCNFYFSIV